MSQGDHRDEVKKREDAQNSILQVCSGRVAMTVRKSPWPWQATKNRLISEAILRPSLISLPYESCPFSLAILQAERVMSRNQATPLHIRAQWACENHLEAQQTMDPWTEVPQGLKQPLIRRAAYTPCPPRPARGCHLSRRELQALLPCPPSS